MSDTREPLRHDHAKIWPVYEFLLPRSLRLRLVLPFIVLIGVVLLVLTVLLGNVARTVYVDRLTDELEIETRTLGAIVSLADDRLGTDIDADALIGDLPAVDDRRITLIDADGNVVADTQVDSIQSLDNQAFREEIREALTSARGVAERTRSATGEQFLYVATQLDDPARAGSVLRVAVPLQRVDDIVAQVQRYMLFAAVIALVLATALALFIGGKIGEPLEALRRHAQRVGHGDLGATVPPSPTREFDEVGLAFDFMTSQLRTSLNDLEMTRDRLEAVLGGLDDGVVITDDQGSILRLNRAAATMLNASETQARGRPFIQVARDHELDALLSAALDGDHHRIGSFEHGLNRRTLRSSATTVAGRFERLGLVVLRDITDLRRLEGVRRDFVANVSHELRTPLTSIRALVETLEAGAIDDPELTQDFLSRIVHEVDRLTALVEDLLDLARLEAGRTPMRLEDIVTREVLERAGERLRAQIDRARLELQYDLPDTLPDILADRRSVEQVVINLIHNAIKFTPPGGVVRLGAEAEGDRVVVRVSDTGAGIAADDVARLFERFYKSDKARRSEGTGLGLAIAKHIVQAHGGDISVRSEPGEGSEFSFTLLQATSLAAQTLRDRTAAIQKR